MRKSNIKMVSSQRPTVAGLFAGIGGIEFGLHAAGFETEFLCEIDEAAQAVLKRQFPGVALVDDVCAIKRLPDVDVVTAGFPCQDLSQAGNTAGITGSRSGLIGEVLRLLEQRKRGPKWLLVENVPFMLQLNKGEAMHHITDALSALGFTWAYRVMDSRSFGLAQRRRRVYLLASRTEDPRAVLFGPDVEVEESRERSDDQACGFYWTEGLRGLGWAVDAVPTLKGGSTIGIASPPAIWMPSGEIVTPEIRDAERLQGFPADWTKPAVESGKRKAGYRWKLVGNAVSVPAAQWIAERLMNPVDVEIDEAVLELGKSWPNAAWGREGEFHRVIIGERPTNVEREPLVDFLSHPVAPLSQKAANGFLNRASKSSLKFPEGLIAAVEAAAA